MNNIKPVTAVVTAIRPDMSVSGGASTFLFALSDETKETEETEESEETDELEEAFTSLKLGAREDDKSASSGFFILAAGCVTGLS